MWGKSRYLWGVGCKKNKCTYIWIKKIGITMDHLDSGSTDIVNILKLNSKAIFAYKPIKDMILPLDQ